MSYQVASLLAAAALVARRLLKIFLLAPPPDSRSCTETAPKAMGAQALWATVRKAMLGHRSERRAKLASIKRSSLGVICKTQFITDILPLSDPFWLDAMWDETGSRVNPNPVCDETDSPPSPPTNIANIATETWSAITEKDIDFGGVHRISKYYLPFEVRLRIRHSECCIFIWKYGEHPIELVPHHFCFEGDEDWVALVPPVFKNTFIDWLQPGGRFGCCDVSCNDCCIFPNYTVYVGCHA